MVVLLVDLFLPV